MDTPAPEPLRQPTLATFRAESRVRGGAVPLFTATTFLSAALLFSLQPMFAKMVLPVLGGSSSVWAVALCFFQGALLAGYSYAYGLVRFVPFWLTGVVHVVFCATALLFLPIGLPQSWTAPPPGEPYLWQLELFALAIGLPFAVIAANAPLLQAWFAASGHPRAKDPYFLYAASNLGSFVALLSYPFVLEPWLGLRDLSLAWSCGFVLLVLAITACFLTVRGRTRTPATDDEPVAAGAPAPPWHTQLVWMGLAFVPAALLTAFTTHIATDVASAPLLWVVPLSLYLLTFVLAFRERAVVPRRMLLGLHLAAVIVAMLELAQTKYNNWFASSIPGVAVFFVGCLVAHRTLYERRPAPLYLTQFYLFIALGGVLGGLFSALAAPKLFSEVFEYPLLVALTMACRPGVFRFDSWRELAVCAACVVLGLAVVTWGPQLWAAYDAQIHAWDTSAVHLWLASNLRLWGITAGITFVLATLLFAAWRYPQAQLALALCMFLALAKLPSSVHQAEAERSYFGVYRVTLSFDEQYNVLTHGTTLHGAQRIRDAEGNRVADTTPGTYYHPTSPMAKSIGIVRAALAAKGETGRYGVVGLGTGSLACLSQPDEKWRFFEIDPLVVQISTWSGYFTYLRNCQPEADIVLGDARLSLAKEKDESFDLLIVDAFTSDAIPVHLMTVEAVRLYLAKLRPNGVVVLHTSNRYLDLDDVLGATLKLLPGIDGVLVSDDTEDGSYGANISTVVVFAKSREVLSPFRTIDGAAELDRDRLRPWSDDHSDILSPFLAKLRP